MKLVIPLFISLIAGLSTSIGALIIFLKIKDKNINKFITFCLSFSLAIMIGISITDLIPASFFDILINFNLAKATVTIILSFLSGVGVVLILNRLTNKNEDNLYKLGILNMITLIIHNFPEGIATFLSSYNDINVGLKLSLAIMLHNIPEGIAIAVPIYYATNNKKKALNKTLISGLSEPIGALMAYLILFKYINNQIISIILLFVAGIMISISIHKMLPVTLKYNCNKYIYIGIGVGILFILINIIIF